MRDAVTTGRSVAELAEGLAAGGEGVEIVEIAGSAVAAETRARGATHDSRNVRSGDVFLCLRGGSHDGHDFAAGAVAAGAVALLVDHPLESAVPQLVVADTRRAAGTVAALVHDRPSRHLLTMGVTGTNGKTTVTELLATAFGGLGRTVGAIGTLHGVRTTPESAELQAQLAGFVADGCDAVVMEVSSHALALHRVDGTDFDVVGFTNLGHDHLDLHGTHEAYFRAKARLFDGSFSRRAVVNVDDVHGSLIAADLAGSDDVLVTEVRRSELADVVVEVDHHRYRWRGLDVHVGIGGDFNVDNSHLALEMLVAAGVDPGDAASAIGGPIAVPGRFEVIDHPVAARRGVTVVVDYAHTPDGLEQLFGTARDVAGTGRLIAVYGCGGDRDRDKRPAMGAIGAERCDLVVFTSDNPRTEDPQRIIDDMWTGVSSEYRPRVRSAVDRREAIDDALTTARSADLVVIAGRGHEPVQDLGDRRVDFDDREVVRHLLDRLEPLA